MATQPLGPDSVGAGQHWPAAGATYNRAQLMAATRALLVALALLGALALIVLF